MKIRLLHLLALSVGTLSAKAQNVGIGTTSPQARFHVESGGTTKYAVLSKANPVGTDTVAGVVGIADSPSPVAFSAGVRGESNSTGTTGIGVLGIHKGGGWGVAGFTRETGAGLYGSVGHNISGGPGTGGYGVLGENFNSNGAGGAFVNSGPNTGRALYTSGGVQLTGIGEGNNRVLTSDASGNAVWRQIPAYIHTAIAANTSGHVTVLGYPGALQTDILFVTPVYNPPGGAPAAYNNHPIGVSWTGTTWAIFNQDLSAIINTSYNVLIIRQ